MKITVAAKAEAAGAFPNVEQLLTRAGCTDVEVKNAAKVFQVSFVAPSSPGKQLYLSATPDVNAFQLKIMQAFKKDGIVLKWSGLNLRKASISMIFVRA